MVNLKNIEAVIFDYILKKCYENVIKHLCDRWSKEDNENCLKNANVMILRSALYNSINCVKESIKIVKRKIYFKGKNYLVISIFLKKLLKLYFLS